MVSGIVGSFSDIEHICRSSMEPVIRVKVTPRFFLWKMAKLSYNIAPDMFMVMNNFIKKNYKCILIYIEYKLTDMQLKKANNYSICIMFIWSAWICKISFYCLLRTCHCKNLLLPCVCYIFKVLGPFVGG